MKAIATVAKTVKYWTVPVMGSLMIMMVIVYVISQHGAH